MKTVPEELRTSACAIAAERSSDKAFFENADKPTLHGLAYALRHPDTWPEGFVWDYGDCEQCAMGLAHTLWKQVPKTSKKTGASLMARFFAIPYENASTIFMGKTKAHTADWVLRSSPRVEVSGYLWWKTERHYVDWSGITPEMVADQIDKYIATAE